MKTLLFIISIIIVIGGSYSIGFYNGNDNANSKIDMAISGGNEFMKIYPPGESAKNTKSSSGAELSEDEKEILAKVKSGEMSMDEVPEDLRNKVRTGFLSTDKTPMNNPTAGIGGSKQSRMMTGSISKIEGNMLFVETQRGTVQVVMDNNTVVNSIIPTEKTNLKTENQISIKGNNKGLELTAEEITILN